MADLAIELTSAQKVLVAAALADRHGLTIGDALDYSDTVARALRVEGASTVVAAALVVGN